MRDVTERIEIEVSQGVAAELRYLLELLTDEQYGPALTSVEDLGRYVMTAIADGSRRPGSWERQMLSSLGLVSERDEHHVYRPGYGPPESESEEGGG